jgi:hypothetical protein
MYCINYCAIKQEGKLLEGLLYFGGHNVFLTDTYRCSGVNCDKDPYRNCFTFSTVTFKAVCFSKTSVDIYEFIVSGVKYLRKQDWRISTGSRLTRLAMSCEY